MKKNYTLIELLAAMTIFIIMMGILFNVFSVGADITSSQQTKVEIVSDASVFFSYLTNDINNVDIDSIEKIKDKDNTAKDPDDGNQSNNAAGTRFSFDANNIGLFSSVTPYDEPTLISALDTNGDSIPDLKPYIIYEYVSSEKVILRRMSDDEPSTFTETSTTFPSTSVDDTSPIILEGVSDFEVKVWDDYPGGTELTTSPLSSKPSCITISVTLTNPNPGASDILKERQKRTISKTIYIDR